MGCLGSLSRFFQCFRGNIYNLRSFGFHVGNPANPSLGATQKYNIAVSIEEILLDAFKVDIVLFNLADNIFVVVP